MEAATEYSATAPDEKAQKTLTGSWESPVPPWILTWILLWILLWILCPELLCHCLVVFANLLFTNFAVM